MTNLIRRSFGAVFRETFAILSLTKKITIKLINTMDKHINYGKCLRLSSKGYKSPYLTRNLALRRLAANHYTFIEHELFNKN